MIVAVVNWFVRDSRDHPQGFYRDRWESLSESEGIFPRLAASSPIFRGPISSGLFRLLRSWPPDSIKISRYWDALEWSCRVELMSCFWCVMNEGHASAERNIGAVRSAAVPHRRDRTEIGHSTSAESQVSATTLNCSHHPQLLPLPVHGAHMSAT